MPTSRTYPHRSWVGSRSTPLHPPLPPPKAHDLRDSARVKATWSNTVYNGTLTHLAKVMARATSSQGLVTQHVAVQAFLVVRRVPLDELLHAISKRGRRLIAEVLRCEGNIGVRTKHVTGFWQR